MSRKATSKEVLTEPDKLFAHTYLSNGYNQTQAYLKAHPNVKYNTAEVEGSKLLRKPIVYEYIKDLETKQLDDLDITSKRILQGMATIAFLDAKDLYTDQGKLRELSKMGRNSKAIKAIKMDYKPNSEGKMVPVIAEIEFNNRDVQLKNLAQIRGLFDGHVPIGDTGDFSGPYIMLPAKVYNG